MAKSLFITYDGLTDTLGQSQILPYLTGLAKLGHEIFILSCEKKNRYQQNKKIIENICTDYKIKWHPLFFHTKPPILAKYFDLNQLTKTAFRLNRKEHFDIIHCRSYLSAAIGIKLKKSYGSKFLFDMRGFWVDERVDGGLWDTRKYFYRIAYKKWKQKEGQMIRNADHIISLTESGKKEIEKWPSFNNTPITVIPCSADLIHFSLTDASQKKNAKKLLQIQENNYVLSYLGSLGTWYLIEEMLLFFRELQTYRHASKFLILTPDDPLKVYVLAEKLGINREDIIIRFAQRKDVPVLMKASDVSVSFIKPAYSKIASSPTKLGELLSMGIPVICNDIGDVSSIIKQSNGGYLIKDFNAIEFELAINYALSLDKSESVINREEVYNYYSLEKAINNYDTIYNSL